MNWISVKDRLPAKSGSYLACRKFGNTHFVWIYDFAMNLSDIDDNFEDENHGGWWECDSCEGVQYFDEVKGITHWMPLPEPPKETN